MSSLEKRPASGALRFSIDQIPADGMRVEFEIDYPSLMRELKEEADPVLVDRYTTPITGELYVFRVGSKVDLRGNFKSFVSGICDRCGRAVLSPVEGDLTTFLMPADQFSDYDRPGGKVIRGAPKQGSSVNSTTPRLNKRRKKAKELSKVATDREFEGFGSFDGVLVDVRPLLRESLVLNLPLQQRCEGECLSGILEASEQQVPLNKSFSEALSSRLKSLI